MCCVGVTGAVCTVCVLEMCQRKIPHLYHGIYCPRRQDMVSELSAGALGRLLVCTFIVTLSLQEKKTDTLHKLTARL